jgi:hypothetical protein
MNEHDSSHKKQAEPGDVEQRLSAYYGPPLPEQTLPPAAWHAVRLRLGVQENAQCRPGRRLHLPRKRSRAFVPAPMLEAFARIVSEAGVPATQARLHYRLVSRMHEPTVRSSWLSRRAILLTLPLDAATSMQWEELDVLLATGLARSISARQLPARLMRFLLAGLVLLAGVTLIVCWIHHLPLIGALLALALCVVVAWCWQALRRRIAFHADRLMVGWLGRGPACSGLHSLAERSRAPRRRRWGEPSLIERIERVCGTGVPPRENRLTLVG